MALEAHSQNLMVRVDKWNKTVLGFALRDMNGVKLHVPTLQSQGIAVDKKLAEMAETQCDSIKALWKRCSLALIQCHAMLLLRSLGLDNSQGWSIVRNELENVLLNRECPMGQSLHKFFLAQNTEYPCYLRASLPDKRLEVSCNMRIL
jgi:siderophore synthetase component